MEKKDGKIGLLDTTTILVGGMIGSAIFSLSGVTIGTAGPAAILSWVVAGLVLLAYGIICAELCSIYPNSGGVFMFPAKAFGTEGKDNRYWGWISGWTYLFSCVGGLVFSCSYIATYIGIAIPALQIPGDPFMSIQPQYGIIIAVAAVVIAGVLNVVQIGVTGKANTIMTVLLSITMVAFVIIAFAAKTPEGVVAFTPANFKPFFGGTQGGTGFFAAIPVAMLAYGSIVAAAFMVGEIRNPNKTVPKAMSLAMGITVVLYVLVMIGTIGLISADALNASHMNYTPQFGAAWLALGHITWLPGLVALAAVLALMTTALVLVILAARTLQAAALSGVLPKAFAKNDEKTGVPVFSTIVITVISIILVIFPSLTNFIINFGALNNVLVVVILSITVLAARKKNPPSVFKAPGGNILPILVLVVLTICYGVGIYSDIQGGTYNIISLIVATVGYFAVGQAIYFLGTRSNKA
ncbi:MAG: APC family permease [Christensenellaceae bacterium]|nr:APC family permease [Christensenellaceae bacterium]